MTHAMARSGDLEDNEARRGPRERQFRTELPVDHLTIRGLASDDACGDATPSRTRPSDVVGCTHRYGNTLAVEADVDPSGGTSPHHQLRRCPLPRVV